MSSADGDTSGQPARANTDPRVFEGVRLFDAGHHWEAHEAWEAAWKADGAEDRDFIKGLIQVTAACYHLRRGNRRPVAWLLGRARHHLTVHDDPRWPFDREDLLELIEDIAEAAPSDPLPLISHCLRHHDLTSE